jgi:hypothetical protein
MPKWRNEFRRCDNCRREFNPSVKLKATLVAIAGGQRHTAENGSRRAFAVASDNRMSFQQIADEAFADFLKKHKQPVGLMASLKESVGVCQKPRQRKQT